MLKLKLKRKGNKSNLHFVIYIGARDNKILSTLGYYDVKKKIGLLDISRLYFYIKCGVKISKRLNGIIRNIINNY